MQSSVGATQWGRDHLKKSGKSTAARPSGDLWLLERKQGMISGPAHPPGRPTVRSGRLFQLAVIALLGLAALISVAPVEAQSVASFVSNFDQGQDSSTFTRGVRAQSFNTGWDAGRITLHSVDIRVESASTIPDSAQSRFSMYLCPPNADGFPCSSRRDPRPYSLCGAHAAVQLCGPGHPHLHRTRQYPPSAGYALHPGQCDDFRYAALRRNA